MKSILAKLCYPGDHSNQTSLALLILRISVGILMLSHGVGKLERLFDDVPITFSDPLGVGASTSLALTVFAEVFCSLLLILGLATRLSTVPLLITMLVISFIVQNGEPFGKKELPLLFGVNYLVIMITGAGKYSLDNRILNKVIIKR
jgi:putative oxidoreductase